jgi:hypothetical protein
MTSTEHEPAYPRASAWYLVINTGRRAAARIAALAPVVEVYEAELTESGRPDKQGNRTAHLYGDGQVVADLAQRVLPALIECMEDDAAEAARAHNAHLRRLVAREELGERDLPAERRAFRREFLIAWGRAYAEHIRALARGTTPDTEPPADPDAAPDPVAAARRAVAESYDTAYFVREVTVPVLAARARMTQYRQECHAAGIDPATGKPPTPDPYEERAEHLAVFGAITGEDPWLRLPLTLANAGEKAESRVEAATEIIQALGASVTWRREADRWGQFSTDITGPRPALELLRARLGVILAQAESAARRAVRDIYGPSIESKPLSAWQRASRRSGWAEDFTVGYCTAYGYRISAARSGDAQAVRAGLSPESTGALHDKDGNPYDLDEAGRRLGKATADRLPAGEFAVYPAELGFRRPPAPAAQLVITSVSTGEDLDDGRSWARVADTAAAPGRVRILALAPVLQACRVSIGHIGPDYARGGWERRAVVATLGGHPQLTALAARTLPELAAQMDADAARAARRASVPEAERSGWIEAYRTGWGRAYAARLRAALAGAGDALAELPDPAAPAAFRAALDVDEVPAAQIHRLAARVAAVTDPAGLPRRTVWQMEIMASPLYPANYRSRAALDIARAYGLATDYPEIGDPDHPDPRDWEREVIRLAGPETLADAVTGALPTLFERAEAVVAAHLPALERQLDQRRTTRHNPAARDAARSVWAASVVSQFLTAYAERIEAARAGDPAARRRGARTGELDTRVAQAAADAIEAAEFAGIAAACAAAESALDTAWNERLPRPQAGPRPHLVIVPCGRAKLNHAAPAAALYTGSYARAAFKAARALREADPSVTVAILSARHGLITDLEQEIEPYETTIGDPDAISSAHLRRQAAAAGLTDAEVTILAGSRYATLAAAVWPDARTPLAGAGGIGYQLQRLAQMAAGQPTRALEASR